MGEMLKCVECGTPFAQKTGLRPMKYCGTSCRTKKNKRVERESTPFVSETKNCDICSTPFQTKSRHSRYCSMVCHKKAWWINNRERHNARVRKRRQDKPEWYRKNEPRYSDTRRSKVYASAPWRFSLHGRKSYAFRKGIPFDLTNEWAAARWTGCCELTGIPFTYGGKKRQGPLPTSMTIDRIIPSLGYVQSNCRLVLHAVNAMKSDGTEEFMISVACALTDRHRSKIDVSPMLSLPG